MKKCIFIFLAFVLLGCNRNFISTYEYNCAQQLTEEEINRLTLEIETAYSQEDMDLLTQIAEVFNAEKSSDSVGVSYNLRNEELLVLDVFGFENEENIDRAVCMLKEQENLQFPKRTILLFHESNDEEDDAGIMAGLKL